MLEQLRNWCKVNSNFVLIEEKKHCICIGIIADKLRCLIEFSRLEAFNHAVEIKKLDSGTYFIGVRK